mgnify:CR=1 FL=1
MNTQSSNIIIFYTGYQIDDWSPEILNSKGLGGSEIALYNIAIQFSQLDYEVYIVGDVIEGLYENIQLLKNKTCHKKLKEKKIKAIIATNYIHYLNEFEGYSYQQSFFWLHNTSFYNTWRQDKKFDLEAQQLLKDDRIDAIVCVSQWQKDLYIEKHPELNPEKFIIIGNGINTSLFPQNIKTIPRSFIYSSTADRGLQCLTEIWIALIQCWPDATLKICSPLYGMKLLEQLRSQLNLLPNVEVLGSLPPKKLYNELAKAEYWLHPTHYDETYCITALEMQMSETTVITSDLAALKTTVADRGILINNDDYQTFRYECLKSVIHLDDQFDEKAKLINEGKKWALKQDWSIIMEQWQKIIN